MDLVLDVDLLINDRLRTRSCRGPRCNEGLELAIEVGPLRLESGNVGRGGCSRRSATA
jgi:hypothetical protein